MIARMRVVLLRRERRFTRKAAENQHARVARQHGRQAALACGGDRALARRRRSVSQRARPRAIADGEVDRDAGEHREAEPVVVQERAKAAIALARADEPEMPQRTESATPSPA